MKESTVDTFLFCDHCREETEHAITYLNDKISTIECLKCAKCLDRKMDISNEIYNELYSRIRSKPSRMTEEMRDHLNEFLLSFPKRAISKPFRVIREARKMLGFYKKYRAKKSEQKQIK